MTESYTSEEIEKLWDGMGSVRFEEDGDSNLVFPDDYGPFHKGDSLQGHAYCWFDKNYDGGVYRLLYGGERHSR